jgi:hypothetical protein
MLALGRWRQEDRELAAKVGYIARSSLSVYVCLYKKKKIKKGQRIREASFLVL